VSHEEFWGIFDFGQSLIADAADRGVWAGGSMNQIPVWYERKFDFSFPAELYPNVSARLRGTPARLEEILQNSADQIRLEKPQGKWSAQEHAGHLLDLEPLWMARVEDFFKDGEGLSVTDLQNRKTDAANYNARPLDQILSDFRNARLALVKRVSQIEPGMFGRTLIHPRLKQPMRLVDHLYFVAEHDDHHLAWMWHLISE
jgi:uncharacterized damage-inducible protein DinB